MKVNERLSQMQIEELAGRICERDRKILQSLQKCRYLTTDQIKRLHFNKNTTPTAALRAANRNLKKLSDWGVIGALRRRIGGVRAGSASYVWALRSAGFKLLCLDNANETKYKRFSEPSPRFLEHTLLVAEAYLQLIEICNQHRITLTTVQIEPECWRWYEGKGGTTSALRPDLYAVTQNGGYEDCWFLEIDRATESTTQVLSQCERYLRYWKSDLEQNRNGVFPYVVWVVPSKCRAETLRQRIRMEYPRGCEMFITITPDEVETLITGGAEAYLQRHLKGEIR